MDAAPRTDLGVSDDFRACPFGAALREVQFFVFVLSALGRYPGTGMVYTTPAASTHLNGRTTSFVPEPASLVRAVPGLGPELGGIAGGNDA